ncbi:glycosyltransferase family 2 protein [Clostridium sp. 1001271B_151109_B4]|uniref:glycosyltransferase family 2 protein n=1 Tax=Clostridium sp. 1001271B_151109_B4 TaxID=2787148 RepID=UPI0018A965FE|nr:glycosyltransferase family 2 protein [Clostridium sp. 1001271B_151109_B4]
MVGIVIANWNGEKLIDKCLSSLENQLFKDFKVYIIDNDSKDNSINIINSYKEKLNIDLVEMDHNSGFAPANNIGIKKAINEGCNYVLTLNNDVEVPSDSLSKAIKFIEDNKEYDVFQLFMINYFERNKCDAAGLVFNEKLIPSQVGYREEVNEVLGRDITIEGACAGAAIYSAKALEKVKLDNGDYFDSKFFAYYEDVDLSLRLKRAGFKTTVLKESIVYHMHSATGNKTSGFKEYYLARNLFMYTKRNQSLEKYKKAKKTYYIILIINLLKNFNMEVLKSVFKGIKDGNKEAKKIEYKEFN